MKIQPWFKFYAADFLLDPDVDDLPLEAQAILIRCWAVCWRDGYLPVDPKNIARKILVDPKKVKKWYKNVSIFFIFHPENEMLFVSERMEKERGKAIVLSQARKAGAAETNRKIRERKEKIDIPPNAERSAERHAERNAERNAQTNALSEYRSTESITFATLGNTQEAPAAQSQTSSDHASCNDAKENIPEKKAGRQAGRQAGITQAALKDKEKTACLPEKLSEETFDINKAIKELERCPGEGIDSRVLLAAMRIGVDPGGIERLESSAIWSSHGLWAILEALRIHPGNLLNPAGFFLLLACGAKPAEPYFQAVLRAFHYAGWEQSQEDERPTLLRKHQTAELNALGLQLMPVESPPVNISRLVPLAAIK